MLPGWAPTSVRWGFRARRGASTVGGMRRLLLLAVLVALAAAAPARAQTVTLWGCHGPGGEPLPFAYDASTHGRARRSRPVGRRLRAPPAARCGSRFERPDPARGAAGPRCASPRPPSVRRSSTSGSAGGATGPGYWARTSSTALETLAAGSLDGSLFAAATGDWVELGLRCETPDPRCDAPDAARRPALRRADRARRRRAHLHRRRRARASRPGRSSVAVDARDSGIGVARVDRDARRPARRDRARRPGPLRRALARRRDDRPAARRGLPAERPPDPRRSTPRRSPTAQQRLELLVADGAGNTAAKGYRRARGQRPADADTEPARRCPPPGGIAIAPPPPPLRRTRRAQARPSATRSPATACSRSARAAPPRRRRRARSR